MAETLIEARRRVIIPYKTGNGTMARHTFFPPGEVLVNRIDSGLLSDLRKNENCQAMFDQGVLTEVGVSRANDYVEGKAKPEAPEVPPVQAAAEEAAKELDQAADFPAPVEGKAKGKIKSS